jgi:Dyp-type peroxidase family
VEVPGPAWAANGSFVVLRRLRQDVAGFWRFVRGAAGDLDVEPVWLASRLVGRWPGGAPVELAEDDRPELARANDFGFFADDAAGVRCPLAAHIRKVNPRDIPTEQGGANDTLTRLFLRRGIVYGPPVADPPAVRRDDGVDRGLLFVGHMASIVGQFEFIQSTWCNDVAKPEVGAGEDPIIGRPKEGTARTIVLRHGPRPVDLRLPRSFVTATGGGYFFAPSLSALAALAGRRARRSRRAPAPARRAAPERDYRAGPGPTAARPRRPRATGGGPG